MSGHLLRAAFFLCGCIAFLNLYSTQSILPALAHAFAISAGSAGWTITATTLGIAVLAPFVGRLVRGWPPLRVIGIAAVLLAVPVVVMALAPSFGVVLVARAAEGCVIPLVFATSVAQIGELWRGPAVREVMSLYVAGTIFGGFAGRFLAGTLTQLWNWRVAMVALAGLTLAIALAIGLAFTRGSRAGLAAASSPHLQASDRLAAAGGIQPVITAPLLGAYAIGFVILLSQVATFTFASLRLSLPPFGLAPSAIGSIYAVFLLALVVVPLAGRWARRWSARRMILAASAIAATGTLLASSSVMAFLLPGLALVATGVFLCQAACSAFITETAGPQKEAAVGLYLAAYYLGGSAGAVLPIPFWQAGGWPAVAVLIILFQLSAGIIARVAWRAD